MKYREQKHNYPNNMDILKRIIKIKERKQCNINGEQISQIQINLKDLKLNGSQAHC